MAIEQTVTIQGEKLSAVDDMVTALFEATNKIATKLQVLQDEVNNLDPAVAAKFQPLLDELNALGADPDNPVPDPTV